MLDLHHQHPGEVVARPVLVELPGVLLLDPVVAVEVEPGGVLALQIRLRRLLPPAPEGVGEVAVVDGDRVAGLGVVVEAVRDEHPGPEFGRRPPELGEEVALDPDVLHVLRLGRHRQRGDLLVEHDLDGGRPARSERDRRRGGVEVAGLPVPHLALAAVGRQLHDVAVGALVGLVAVQERLHPVLAGRHVGQAADRVAERPAVHGDRLARRPAVDVHAECQLAVRTVHDLEAGLRGVVLREHEDEPAVERVGAAVGREGHREGGATGSGAPEGGERRGQDERAGGEWLGVAHGRPPPPGPPVCRGIVAGGLPGGWEPTPGETERSCPRAHPARREMAPPAWNAGFSRATEEWRAAGWRRRSIPQCSRGLRRAIAHASANEVGTAARRAAGGAVADPSVPSRTRQLRHPGEMRSSRRPPAECGCAG